MLLTLQGTSIILKRVSTCLHTFLLTTQYSSLKLLVVFSYKRKYSEGLLSKGIKQVLIKVVNVHFIGLLQLLSHTVCFF